MKREITLGMVVGCVGLMVTLAGCVGTPSTDGSGAEISGEWTERADGAEDGGAAPGEDGGDDTDDARCTTALPDGWYTPDLCRVSLIHCEEGERFVSNECGCGCEPITCTAYFAPLRCRPEERVVCETGADGCQECHCEPVSCLPIAPPRCDADETVVCRNDDYGCAQCRCEPITCTAYFAPFTCEVGERAVCGTGADGCQECHCELVSCLPFIAPTNCAPGESPVCTDDEHGCPQCRCAADVCRGPDNATVWYAQDFCIRANIRCDVDATFVSNECGCGCVATERARS